jgi:hypothetical protein
MAPNEKGIKRGRGGRVIFWIVVVAVAVLLVRGCGCKRASDNGQGDYGWLQNSGDR